MGRTARFILKQTNQVQSKKITKLFKAMQLTLNFDYTSFFFHFIFNFKSRAWAQNRFD